jgi:hypothetical protein
MTRRVACGICLVLFGLASAVHAQDAEFRAGIDAREAKRWGDVVTQMSLAIKAKPEEENRRVGSRFGGVLGRGETYLPHFFLGEALFYQNDCAGALDEWWKSQQQGVINERKDLLDILIKGYAACEARGVLPPVKYDALLVKTRQTYIDVNALAQKVSNLGQANLELWRPDMKEMYDRASGDLKDSQTRLTVATRTRTAGDFNDASAAAERARGVLTTIESNLNAAIETYRSVQDQAREIGQIIDAADALDRAIESKKAMLTASHVSDRQAGRDAIGRARERLSGGARASSTAVLNEARGLAQDASTRLKQILADLARIERGALERTLTEAQTAAQEAFSFVDGAFVTLDRLITEKPSLLRPEMTTEREAIERQVRGARRLLGAARKAENVEGIREATRMTSEARDRLNALITTFGPVTLTDRGVHPALQQGARLFFSGEYQQALSALSPPDGFAPDVPLQLHVHLFRAAALHALFVRSGEQDQSLRIQALTEVKRCMELSPEFQPDTRAFSPRFVTFFQDGKVEVRTEDTAGVQR